MALLRQARPSTAGANSDPRAHGADDPTMRGVSRPQAGTGDIGAFEA